jgi:hypothetical protein
MADSSEQLELFSPETAALPDYRIRESDRARHVSIKVHLNGQVEVVVPLGFDQRQVPELLAMAIAPALGPPDSWVNGRPL